MHIEQITAVACVEYIAGVGHGGAGFGQGGELSFTNAPVAAIIDMQPQLDINNGFQTIQAMAQFADVAAFVSRQRISTAKVNQKQVVLLQIVAKGVLLEGAFAQLTHEVMFDIGAPVVVASSSQVSKAVAHGVSGSQRGSGAWA